MCVVYVLVLIHPIEIHDLMSMAGTDDKHCLNDIRSDRPQYLMHLTKISTRSTEIASLISFTHFHLESRLHYTSIKSVFSIIPPLVHCSIIILITAYHSFTQHCHDNDVNGLLV